MKNTIIASVIIPTYNYAHFISEAINSVLNSNFSLENLEIIIVDDGSTDNTKEVLTPFIDKGIIKYYFQKNSGKANATNKAIQFSRGKYIFNLDADDYFFPNKISKTIKIFESDHTIVHVGSPASIKYSGMNKMKLEELPLDILEKKLDGNKLLEKFYNNHILYGGGTTYSAKAEILKKINIPDDVDMYIDEFLILAILPFGKSYFIKQSLSVWRVHESNYSGSKSSSEKEKIKAQRLLQSSAGVLFYLQNNNFSKNIVRIYQLKDATRRIAFKEVHSYKKISDIVQYAIFVLFHVRPSLNIIKNYQVLNRLLPTSSLRFLKKLRFLLSKTV